MIISYYQTVLFIAALYLVLPYLTLPRIIVFYLILSCLSIHQCRAYLCAQLGCCYCRNYLYSHHQNHIITIRNPLAVFRITRDCWPVTLYRPVEVYLIGTKLVTSGY